MGCCSCDDAKRQLEEYLHRELCESDAAAVREHIASCKSCQAEADIGVALTHVVARACHEQAPEELRLRIAAKIEKLTA